MKKTLFVLLLAAFGFSMLAQEAWHQGTIDSGLAKAKNENKILFLKFYSDT
jgi:hypothetical protein